MLGGERGIIDGDAGVGSAPEDVDATRERDAASGVRAALDPQLGRGRRYRLALGAEDDLVAVAQPGLQQRQPGRQLLTGARECQRLRRGRGELACERLSCVADRERGMPLELELVDLPGPRPYGEP